MSNYEKNKDKLIWNRKLNDEGQYCHILSIWIYDNGEPKLQINKIQFNEYGFRFMKMGRMNTNTMKELSKKINEALEFIKEYDGEKIDIEIDFQKSDLNA